MLMKKQTSKINSNIDDKIIDIKSTNIDEEIADYVEKLRTI